ncbi:GNAT family N-acetyltransferase [Fructilactobacillus vespulae]|uniref:GNAT family N-acetyltransferase n=1 Tax=Fructilactobacillus vespulae TaxID=1249630 RepID=UPI0039B4DDCC
MKISFTKRRNEMWYVKKFAELTTQELFLIYKARGAVFIEEQQIVENDIDEQDLTAIHVFEIQADAVVAYARVFQMDQHVTFGRVLTSAAVRGTGKGKALLNELFSVIKHDFKGLPIEIDAQVHAIGYYEKSGFQVTSAPFLEAGVSHVKMTHPSF